MGPELVFGNKPAGLPENGLKRADVQFSVSGDRKGLPFTGGTCATQLDVAAALGVYRETELSQDGDHLIPRQPFQPGHRRVPPPS